MKKLSTAALDGMIVGAGIIGVIVGVIYYGFRTHDVLTQTVGIGAGAAVVALIVFGHMAE